MFINDFDLNNAFHIKNDLRSNSITIGFERDNIKTDSYDLKRLDKIEKTNLLGKAITENIELITSTLSNYDNLISCKEGSIIHCIFHTVIGSANVISNNFDQDLSKIITELYLNVSSNLDSILLANGYKAYSIRQFKIATFLVAAEAVNFSTRQLATHLLLAEK